MKWLNNIFKYTNLSDTPYHIEVPDKSLFTLRDENGQEIVQGEEQEFETESDKRVQEMQELIERLSIEIVEKKDELNQIDEDILIAKEMGKKNADKLLQESKEQAQSMINEAKQKAESIKEEAHRVAYETGYKEGMEKAQAEQKSILKEASVKASGLLTQANKEVKEDIFQHKTELVEVIMQIAEKVMRKRFEDMPPAILPLVQDALQKMRDETQVVVRVSPTDFSFVLPVRAELKKILSSTNATLEIEVDDSLKAGDCWVETPNGSVDARLEQQIAVLKKALEGAVSKV